MLIFGNDKNTRGCFMVKVYNVGEGRGAQLVLPSGTLLPENNFAEPIVVTGFSFNEQENVSFVKCFDDTVYTYAFGHDPASQLSVDFIGMLQNGVLADAGGGGGGHSDITQRVVGDYASNRVSVNQNYAKFKVTDTQVFQGFVVGLRSSTADPQHSLQSFSMILQLVEAQGR